MLGVSLFECLLCCTNIVPFIRLAGDSSFVCDGRPQAIPGHRTEVRFSAVAPWLFWDNWFHTVMMGAQQFAIVSGDHGLHVGTAAVAELHSLPVEDAMVPVAWREVFAEQQQEGLANVC